MKNIENRTVAIVIVNWNNIHDTIECIESLKKLSYKNFKVFLIDNGSDSNIYEELKISINTKVKNNEFNFKIDFIRSNINLGFAGGNNIGIKKAINENFDYYWLLNNDTVVTEHSLIELLREIDFNNNIGIIGSKILYYNSDLIWFAGGQVNNYTGKTVHKNFKKRNEESIDILDSDYITGCSLLTRRDLLLSTGLMNEDYFLYYEETDWNLRARMDGWEIKYIPTSLIYHKVSLSSGGERNLSPYVDYYDIRNAYVMIKRNHKLLNSITAYICMYFKAVKKIVRIIIRNENEKSSRYRLIIKAIKDGHNIKMGKCEYN